MNGWNVICIYINKKDGDMKARKCHVMPHLTPCCFTSHDCHSVNPGCLTLTLTTVIYLMLLTFDTDTITF